MTAGVWAVIPVFDEVATLGDVVQKLRVHCPVIVVDDASTDGSGEVAARAGAAEVLRHARRVGKGAALRTGFGRALRSGATAIATLDGDGQHDPADLPRLLLAHSEAPDCLVLGDRFAPPRGRPRPGAPPADIRLRQPVRIPDLSWGVPARHHVARRGFRPGD